MRPAPNRAVLLALLTLSAATCVPAQTAITVDAGTTVRTVDDRVFGVNAVMWDGNTATPQTIDLLKAADVRMIRIPGGSLSDEYHWTTNKSLNNTWSWASGVDTFSALITGLNAQTTAVVNYGSGTPEEAAAWVAYANAPATADPSSSINTALALGTDAKGVNWQTVGYWSALRAAAPLAANDGSNFLRLNRSAPIGIKYWEIGNECYGSWETDQQAVAHDPYTYAVRARDYIARMKAVDPSIKVGVVVVPGEDAYANNTSHPATNPRTGLVHNGWTPVLLATLKSLGVTPDALIYHRYEQTPGRETDAGLLQAARTWPADAADLRQQLTDYLGSAGAGVELVVTENNSVYSDPGKQSTSLVNGLFYADALGSVLQTEFNEFIWWALRNGTPTSNGTILGNLSSSLYGWRAYGDYGVLSSPNSAGASGYYEGYPVYYVMKLLSHFARGGDRVIKATSNNTLLSAYAVRRTDGTLTLLVINKSPTSDATASVSLSGFSPAGSATVYSYGVPQDDAARTGTGVNDVAVSSVANAGATFSMTFAHYAATVVSLAQPPRIVVPPASVTIGSGANIVLAVTASGSGPLAYQWLKDGSPITGATSATLRLSVVSATNAGAYTVVVSDRFGNSLTSAAAAVEVTADSFTPPASKLVNISTRAQVGTGNDIMIAGFTIGGAGAKKVLVRAVGPTLRQWLSGTLVDPQLELTTLAGASIATNDDWSTSDPLGIAAAAEAVGAFPLNTGSKDAALIVTLPPGSYTALVRGADSTPGLAMVEVYDLDPSSAARLINLSTRAQVGTGAQALYGGFTVIGSTSRKLLIRAVGPALNQWLSGTLADPQLDLQPQNGATVASNDNWDVGDATVTTAIQQTGAFPLSPGSLDAALVHAVPEGLYSAIVTGKGGTAGVAMVEIYEAP